MGMVAAPSDPFVVVVHGGKVLLRTPTVQDDVDPIWNHEEEKEIDPTKGNLHCIVFDDDQGEGIAFLQRNTDDDYIGKCEVPLQTHTKEYVLEAPRGEGKQKSSKKIRETV